MSVVVPVYRGEHTLDAVVGELAAWTAPRVSPGGHSFRVAEVLLVFDHGPDRSDEVIRKLAASHEWVKPVWLARNSGQHAATAAGVASSGSDWVVTMDEDGQHVPDDLGRMLDAAVEQGAGLVYARHRDGAPHRWWRNASSSMAKRMARWTAGADMEKFSSYRLLEGSRARAVTAYIGPRTFFDSALLWAFDVVAQVDATTRPEWRGTSGYSMKRLVSHFWTLVLSSGTRPLRLVSLLGLISSIVGIFTALVVVVRRFSSDYEAPGWASTVTVQLVIGGLILFSIGVVAEYIGALLRGAQGKPLYIIVDDPARGPLGRDEP